MKTLLVVLFPALLVSSLAAVETGTIHGIVVSDSSGLPLPYANVVVVGTKHGCMTLADGTYRITGVPPGAYTVKAMLMGHRPAEKTGVVVRAGDSTRVDFALAEMAVGVTQEIAVEADRVSIEIGSGHRIMGFPFPLRHPGYPLAGDFNTEEYAQQVENDFLDPLGNPLSTFSIDVDVGAYGNMRRFVMQDRLPPPDAVRTEEFLNYFDYDYPRPEGDVPFSISLEYSECPWNSDRRLVHIGLRGEELAPEDRGRSNLVFLIDVSGSMKPPNKLPLLQKAFLLLVDQLRDDDLVSIVVYAGASGLALPPTPGREKAAIRDVLQRLSAGGSTAGYAGIQLAYKTAKENFIRGGNNRVILATDGDFNVGVSSTSELLNMIEEKRADGIFLTVLGFGMGNYKDHRLEQLADKGNGNHAYIDTLSEARKVLVDEMHATMMTIAQDVKIQIEFNPDLVAEYRLIGYENRDIADERFRDDTIDAGEVGSGQCSTALYELELIGPRDTSDTDIGTVFVRYRDTDTGKIEEIAQSLTSSIVRRRSVEQDPRFFLAAGAARLAEWLRQSEHARGTNLADVQNLLDQVSAALPLDHDVQELAALAHQAENLPRAP